MLSGFISQIRYIDSNRIITTFPVERISFISASIATVIMLILAREKKVKEKTITIIAFFVLFILTVNGCIYSICMPTGEKESVCYTCEIINYIGPHFSQSITNSYPVEIRLDEEIAHGDEQLRTIYFPRKQYYEMMEQDEKFIQLIITEGEYGFLYITGYINHQSGDG